MNFRLELICVKEDGTEERREVLTFTKEQLVLETLGLTVAEGKKLLAKVQACAVEQQTSAYLEQHRHCAACGRKHRSKGQGRSTVQTLFGPGSVPNPRWQRCACQGNNSQTFRPTAQWLTSHSSPELLYVETKWASLVPYAKVADLLKDVLPVAPTWSQETVRKHLHATAQRMEQALGISFAVFG